jgi:hypothetical protein
MNKHFKKRIISVRLKDNFIVLVILFTLNNLIIVLK